MIEKRKCAKGDLEKKMY